MINLKNIIHILKSDILEMVLDLFLDRSLFELKIVHYINFFLLNLRTRAKKIFNESN